jgi:serine/threonine protein kinase
MIEVASVARVLGRYALHGELAVGGMATIHLGRVSGGAGVGRTVAIKRLRSEFGSDPDFVAVFVEEAQRAARIRHPNVVPVLDVITEGGGEFQERETFLVMEYVEGESLARLLQRSRARGELVPHRIATALLSAALRGLHAAHEARSENGAPLGIVHCGVSPQNLLVGADGIARLLDFGVARATGQVHTTREWGMDANLVYMSPDALSSGTYTPQSDVYAAAVMLWETLTLRPLFEADTQGVLMAQVMSGNVVAPSTLVPGLSAELDAVVLRGLARDPARRWASAGEFARALEACGPATQPSEIGDWVRSLCGEVLALRARLVAAMPRASPSLRAAPGSDAPGSAGERVSQGFALPSAAPTAPIAAQSRPLRSYFRLAGGLAALMVAASPFLFLRAPAREVTPLPPPEVTPAQPSDFPAVPLPAPAPPRTGSVVEDPVPSGFPEEPPAKSGDVYPAPGPTRPKLPAPTPAPKVEVDCDPPFTRDALGHKHFKLHCL